MDEDTKLKALLDLSEQIGLEVRLAPPGGADGIGDEGGSLIRLRGKEILFVNAAASVADQLAAVANALNNRPELEEMYLPPEIRDCIEG